MYVSILCTYIARKNDNGDLLLAVEPSAIINMHVYSCTARRFGYIGLVK